MPSSIRSTRALFAALAALGGFLSLSNAQSVATTPVGAMTYSFPATGATPATTTYISVPLTNASVYSGPIASSTSTTITFAGTPFTAGALSVAGSPFFARIASGTEAGRTVLITANTANTITVDVTDRTSQTTNLDTSGFAVAAGDRVEIIVGDTLASFFGDNTLGNPIIFAGANIAGQADTISVYNKTTAKFDSYYFSNSAGIWRSAVGNVASNNVVLYPEASIAILRRASRPLVSFTALGDVPAVRPKTKTLGNTGLVYVGTRFPADVTLAQLQYDNWTKNNISGQADTISIYNSSTSKFDTYWQRTDNQWRKVNGGATDVSSTVLPAGGAIAVLRRANPLTGAATFVSAPLPYTL